MAAGQTPTWDGVDLASAFAALSLLQEDATWVVGDRDRTTFVAVPAVGAAVIRGLREGQTLVEVGDLARRMMGEPVDIPRFLDGLRDAGILVATPTKHPTRSPRVRGASLGRLLAGRAHTFVWVAMMVAGASIMIAVPSSRPHARDSVVVQDPLANLLILALISTVCTLLHEGAHAVVTGSRGVASRLSIGRRLFFVTAQADLTGLWAVPRARRYLPLLAGMAVDMEIVAILVVCEQVPLVNAGAVLGHVIRAVILVQVSAVLFQCAVFMRTDLYAVIATASGSPSFWRTKSALLRSMCRLANQADRQVLETVRPREMAWARCYLLVFVCGNLAAIVYLIEVLMPGLVRLVVLVAGACTGDLGGAGTWRALLAIALVVAPTIGALMSFVLSSARHLRSVVPALASSGRVARVRGSWRAAN